MFFRRVVPCIVVLALAFCASPAVAHTHNHKAHTASCGNVCLLANASPGWVCDIQGGVVAAGITIVSGGAAAVWSILGGVGWAGTCHIIQDYILTNAQTATLRSTGRNCFYTWSQPYRQGVRRIRCQSYYA